MIEGIFLSPFLVGVKGAGDLGGILIVLKVLHLPILIVVQRSII